MVVTGDRVADPAVEAAERAKHPAWAFVDPPGAAEDIAERAAREALAPLRDIHRPYDRPVSYGSTETTRVCSQCLGPQSWPCLTARLVYREDEL